MGKAERTRQFIIEQAAVIFNEKGIAGTTIDDVLAATKMAKGGLYGHFENKEAIAFTMVDYLLEKLRTKIVADMNKEKTAKGKLYAFIHVYKNPLASYIDGGCPILNFGVESDDTNPVVKQKIQKVIEEVTNMLAQVIHSGITDNEFSATLSPEDFALKILSTLEGGMLISRVLNSDQPMHGLIKMLKSDLALYEVIKNDTDAGITGS